MLVRLAAVVAAAAAVAAAVAAVVVAAVAAVAAEGAGRRADRTCLLRRLSCKASLQQLGAPGEASFGLWARGGQAAGGFYGQTFYRGAGGTHKGQVSGSSGNYSIDPI